MNIGLIGLPNSGKTTIFNALTRSHAQVTAYANTKMEPNRAILEVVDDRVRNLSDMYRPQKTTYANIEMMDFVGMTQGSAREGLFSSKSMGLIKNTDALAIVVGNFREDPAESPAPYRDIEKIDDELLISDLIIAENRLERIEKAYRRGKKTNLLELEEKLLLRIIEHLNSSQPIRKLELEGESEKMIRGFQFLTQKQVMIILNSDDGLFGRNQDLLTRIGERYRVIEFAGKFEMELSQLNDPEDIELFMVDMAWLWTDCTTPRRSSSSARRPTRAGSAGTPEAAPPWPPGCGGTARSPNHGNPLVRTFTKYGRGRRRGARTGAPLSPAGPSGAPSPRGRSATRL